MSGVAEPIFSIRSILDWVRQPYQISGLLNPFLLRWTDDVIRRPWLSSSNENGRRRAAAKGLRETRSDWCSDENKMAAVRISRAH